MGGRGHGVHESPGVEREWAGYIGMWEGSRLVGGDFFVDAMRGKGKSGVEERGATIRPTSDRNKYPANSYKEIPIKLRPWIFIQIPPHPATRDPSRPPFRSGYLSRFSAHPPHPPEVHLDPPPSISRYLVGGRRGGGGDRVGVGGSLLRIGLGFPCMSRVFARYTRSGLDRMRVAGLNYRGVSTTHPISSFFTPEGVSGGPSQACLVRMLAAWLVVSRISPPGH